MIPEDSRKILEGLISKQKKPNLEFVNTETRRRVNPRSDKEEEMVPQIVVDGPTEETSRETEGAAPADTAEDYLKYHTLLLEATKREQGWIEESMNQQRKIKEMEEKMEAVVRDREDVKEEVDRLRKEDDELRKKNGNEAEERFEKERNELRQEILRIKTSRNREKDEAQKQIEEGRATVEQVEDQLRRERDGRETAEERVRDLQESLRAEREVNEELTERLQTISKTATNLPRSPCYR